MACAGKLSVNQKRHDIDRRWFAGVFLMVKTKMEINNTNVMTKPKDYMKNELRNTVKVIKRKTHVRYPSGTPKRDDF